MIHDRIKIIAAKEGLSISKLERELGVGINSLSTTLRRRSAVSHSVIQRLALKFPKYSLSWIVLGTEESPKEQAFNKLMEQLEHSKNG
jgi:transcriptional regulator with XRE-family HTH domain